MKITFDCPDKINGQLTMTIEPADYQEQVEKTLKNYRKKAQVPGFRPGMVPMGMIKKQYGTAVKVEEINKLMGEKLYGYIQENKIEMLGEPLPSEKQVPQDFEKEGDLTFVFDIAVAPEFKIELTDNDERKMEVVGRSVGGGNILITEINEQTVELSGDYPTLIVSHRDEPGVIAVVSQVLAQLNVNIAFMRVFRHGRGRDAYMCIETDTPVTKEMQMIIRQLCKGITELFAV